MSKTHDLGPGIDRYDREHADDPEYLQEKLKLEAEHVVILQSRVEELEYACRQMKRAYEEGSQEEVVWAYDSICKVLEVEDESTQREEEGGL